ncbi:MAG: helix-turn-helix domain-containing protein [Thiotrichaceae bacterium]|nr:helix-turn-helix domain-containing protein [Thiotrichaceae bacterium]
MNILLHIQAVISAIDFASTDNNAILDQVINLTLTESNVSQQFEKQKKKVRFELEKAITLNTEFPTLLKYITAQRLEKAKDILHKEKSPKLAAFSTGFNDLSNFSKQFKDRYHVTPREFLRKQDEL